jgi:uncharacterized damage-inducible protein DinB
MTRTHFTDFDAGHAFVELSRTYLREDYLGRLRKAVAELPEEDLWWRPNEASNSAGNLLLHLAGNARQWIVSGVGRQPDLRHREGEFSATGGLSRAQALTRLEDVLAEVDAVLARLEPGALAERRTIQGNDVTVLEAVYHVVEHFSMHVGQILYIVKLRTGTDLRFWRVNADGSARPSW